MYNKLKTYEIIQNIYALYVIEERESKNSIGGNKSFYVPMI